MKHRSFASASVALLILASARLAFASPELAEDRAYTVAAKFRDRGYYIQPITSGMLSRGQVYRVIIPVTRGLDYLVIGAGDEAATDVDLFVYSDLGTLIIDDRRSLSDALVQFRAQYTGEVYAYIFMARTDPSKGLPSWAAFVGRRGTVAVPEKPGDKPEVKTPPIDPAGKDGPTTPRTFNDASNADGVK